MKPYFTYFRVCDATGRQFSWSPSSEILQTLKTKFTEVTPSGVGWKFLSSENAAEINTILRRLLEECELPTNFLCLAPIPLDGNSCSAFVQCIPAGKFQPQRISRDGYLVSDAIL